MSSILLYICCVYAGLFGGAFGVLAFKRALIESILEAGAPLSFGKAYGKQLKRINGHLKTPLGGGNHWLAIFQTCSILNSFLQVSLLPILNPLDPVAITLLFVLTFQVNFILDGLIQAILFPLRSQLQFKRSVVRHLASQMMLIPSMFMMLITPVSFHGSLRLLAFLTTFMSVLCHNGVGPFKFSLTVQDKLHKQPPVRSLEIYHLSKMLQLLVSLSLVLNLSSPAIYSFCHATGRTWIQFVFHLGLLSVGCCLSFPFLPSYRSDQYKRIFFKTWGLMTALVWALVIGLRFLRGTHV